MRGNRRQRQQANKELINSTVKVGIDKIFSDLALQAVIIRAVKLATPIELQGQMLAQFHVLRLLQLGQCPGPLNMTFYTRCYSAVSLAAGNSKPYNRNSDPALTASLDAYAAYVPAGHRKPHRPALIKDVSH